MKLEVAPAPALEIGRYIKTGEFDESVIFPSKIKFSILANSAVYGTVGFVPRIEA